MKRYIKSTSDFRTFDGYYLDELEELNRQLYIDLFYDIRTDVEVVYISRDSECNYIGAKDFADNYYACSKLEDGRFSKWDEVTFEELAQILS